MTLPLAYHAATNGLRGLTVRPSGIRYAEELIFKGRDAGFDGFKLA